MKMPGKKRKLKKDLKRKLRKEIKKKENKDKKVDKSKVEKQVIDNQTLQQIMMTQMMSSRNRVSNGENTSWIATQNQNNADRIQAQQKINALKTEKQEWERRAKNIEENEKYKELIEKYKQEVADNKKAVEQLQKIAPLEEQLRELESQKAELERKLNDPVMQKEREIIAAQNYLKEMKKNLDASDPEFKKLSEKIAKKEEKLKKYKQQEELSEELIRIKTELKRKESERKAAMEYLRKTYNEELKGVQYNATNLTEILEELTDKKVTEINNYEIQIKRLKEQQQILEKYEQLIKEFNDKRSKVNVSIEYLQEKYPDLLKDIKLDSKNIDEIILDLMNKAVIDIDELNKQLEMFKEAREETKIMDQTKASRDMYEEHFKKENPLFNPIYKRQLNAFGGNITQANKTDAIYEAINEYKAIGNENTEFSKPQSSDSESSKPQSSDSDFDSDFDSEANMTSDNSLKKKKSVAKTNN